jgi:aminotransferase in exopolysaccharide biosynthesis
MSHENIFAQEIRDRIRKVVGDSPVSLHEPTFEGNEWRYLRECLDSGFVSSIGQFVNRFEEAIAEFTGAKYAVAVVNGTEALHIALKLSGVSPGDEVLVPALTFIATANAVTYCGAIPHFVDSEELHLGIDAEKLRNYLASIASRHSDQTVNKETGRAIKAMVPMHTFGHPSNMDALLEVADEFSITLVEDAAESIGSTYKSRHTGTFGLMAALSFNGNKTITSGGGGAILTSDETLAQRARHLTQTARLKHSWEFIHDDIGYNYRMPNINAALGLAQLEQLPRKLKMKRKLFLAYKEVFAGMTGLRVFEEPENTVSNYWLQTIILEKENENLKNDVLKLTNESGITTRPAWMLISNLSPYERNPRMKLACSSSLSKRIINIPSSPNLADKK